MSAVSAKYYWSYDNTEISRNGLESVPPIPMKFVFLKEIEFPNNITALELSPVNEDGSSDLDFTTLRRKDEVWETEKEAFDEFFKSADAYIEGVKEEIEDFEHIVQNLKKKMEISSSIS